MQIEVAAKLLFKTERYIEYINELLDEILDTTSIAELKRLRIDLNKKRILLNSLIYQSEDSLRPAELIDKLDITLREYNYIYKSAKTKLKTLL